MYSTPVQQYEPKDLHFEERVRASFGRQQAMSTLDIKIMRLQPGAIELGMPFLPQFTQQHGFVHAGVISTALDSACGYAAFSLKAADLAVLTVEFKINLLAPAAGEYFRFHAAVIKPGRTLTVCEAHAVAHKGGASKLIATMTGTLMAASERGSIRQ
jgi:uncharacterized protein (TIGR00369 family)